MKHSKLTVAIFSLLLTGNLLAQDNYPYEKNFTSYADYISSEVGISCSIPEGFIDLNQYHVMRRVREDKHAGFMYGPVFQSKDKECIVMYPGLTLYFTKKDLEMGRMAARVNRALGGDDSAVEPDGYNNTVPRGFVVSELQASTGLFDNTGKPLHDSASINFNEQVTIIAGRKARKMFNADSVFLYDLPLQEPYMKEYTHRTSMVLGKWQRGTMVFKWFFTPEGKKKEKKYIKMLSKHIWYDEDFRHEEE